jgi:hypothetical protein
VHPSTKSPHVASFTQTAIAVLLIVPFAVLGKDPVLTLFFWFSGVAVVGVVSLYVLVAISAFVYFRAHPGVESSRWSTTIAPVLSAVLMSGALVLILLNFDTLVGGTGVLPTVLALTVPIAFIVGLIAYSARESQLLPSALADLDHELT